MTIHGVGIDIVDITRFRALWDRYGPSVESRWFDPSELCGAGDRARRLARCLAVKEAVWKALAPTDIRHLAWHEIVARESPDGEVDVELRGRLRHLARDLGAGRILASVTVHGDIAVASAIVQLPDHR